MSRTEDGNGSTSVGWIQALHESIALHGADSPSGEFAGLDSSEHDEIRDCLDLLERARQSQQVIASDAPRHVGRFEIVREIGRGGFGVVFAAIDPRVGRQVALKIPRPEVLVNPAARARFLREAKAAGALAHPNLIPIFEVGEAGPLCYIASALCDGPNLAQWLAGPHDAVGEREAAQLIEAVALGVDHAHRRGVLHRDIKPSNILLERQGDKSEPDAEQTSLSNATPRLTDFGLAKIVESEEDETHVGLLLGTPAYMAPEQAECRIADVGPATDVYALGAVLFELLAGVAPHRGNSDAQTLERVSQSATPRLASYRSRVSADLEAVALKCLEYRPQRRYATAEALADDLRRFSNGEPTVARPTGPIGRTLKWVKRRPAMAAVAAVLMMAAATLSGGGWWYSGQLRTALDQAESQRHETEKHLYAASMSLVDQAIRASQTEHAQHHLDRWIPRPGEPDLRSFAWHYLWRQLHDEELTLKGHTGDVYCVCFSKDGRLLATASQDQTARIWDAATGKCLFVLRGHTGDVNSVAFSPKGRYMATAGDDGTVRTWRIADGSQHRSRQRHQGSAFGVAFSASGASVASCGADGKVVLTSVGPGKLLRTFRGHKDAVGALAFSPDGKFLATCSDDESARLWDVETGKTVKRLRHEGAVNCLSFSADGTQFVTGQRSQRFLRHWLLAQELNPETTEHSGRRATTPTYDWIHAVACHPKSAFYAVATKDGAVDLCRSEDDLVLQRIRGHDTRVWSLSFSPNGRRLATASGDHTVKIWNVAGRPQKIDLDHASCAMSLTKDGQTLAIGDQAGGLAIIDVATRMVTSRMAPEVRASVQALAISPDGARAAARYRLDDRLHVWDIRSKQKIHALQVAAGHVVGAAFSPDGQILAVAASTGELVFYDARTLQFSHRIQAHDREMYRLAYSTDGQMLATIGDTNVLNLWSADGRCLKSLSDPSPKAFECLAFSPDDRLIAVGGTDRIVRVWDAETGQKVAALTGHTLSVIAVAFSPDMRSLATSGDDGAIKLWDLATWQELFTLAEGRQPFTSIAFADGQLIAAGHAHTLRGTTAAIQFWSGGQSTRNEP